MKKSIVLYSAGIALLAFALQWLDYRHAIRTFSTEIYIVIIAAGFAVLGIWVGHRLTARQSAPTFIRNDKAISYLGISEREHEVLVLLAAGLSNKEIADRLCVSANTVKTHVSNLYSKLEVGRRTQAVKKAKSLKIVA